MKVSFSWQNNTLYKVSSVLPLQSKNIVNEVAKLLYHCTYPLSLLLLATKLARPLCYMSTLLVIMCGGDGCSVCYY